MPEISSSQLGYIRRALDISSKSDCAMKHGAVLVHGGKVISVGRNRHKYDSRAPGYTVHAEVDVILSYLSRRHPIRKLCEKGGQV